MTSPLNVPTYPPGLPWYRRFDEIEYATRFLCATAHFKDIPEKTIENFSAETLARFVFESNNIESEGLSYGDTKELLIDGLESDSVLYEYKNLWENTIETRLNLGIVIERLEVKVNNERDSLISIKKGKKRKEFLTTWNHVFACLNTLSHSINARMVNARRCYLGVLLSGEYEFKGDLQNAIKEEKDEIIKSTANYKLNEDFIRKIHFDLSDGLIPSKYAGPGEYRNHRVVTALDTSFPAPSDVPACMKRFVEELNARLERNANPVLLAAWASARLVEIHPFSDFNGRTSRLILNIILRRNGFPFWVSLRSNKKERNRYITSLRHFDRGKSQSVTILLAIMLNQLHHELNRVINLAGHQSLDLAKYDYGDDISTVLPYGTHMLHSNEKCLHILKLAKEFVEAES